MADRGRTSTRTASRRWISDVHRRLGVAPRRSRRRRRSASSGGGQLGRMLALAGAPMGYRVAVLDPDPDCPAASIADRIVVGAYDDVGGGAAPRRRWSDVVTYELEHVAAAVVDALDALGPVRPGGCRSMSPRTGSRSGGSSRRRARGRAVARGPDDRGPAGGRRRRWACRFASRPPRAGTTDAARSVSRRLDGHRWRARALGRPAGEPLLAETELTSWPSCRSSSHAGAVGRIAAFPVAQNRHDAGHPRRERSRRRRSPPRSPRGRRPSARELAVAMGLAAPSPSNSS